MRCKNCDAFAAYRCGACEATVCGKHAKLKILCPSCARKTESRYAIAKVSTDNERRKIQDLVTRFWGEQEQLTFDRRFIVAAMPAYVAKTEADIAGFVSYTEADDAIIIIALGVIPESQGSGIGRSLVRRVENHARLRRKSKLLVSTSNDDLPALAFYQSLGFRIFEVGPDVIAAKHGKIMKGIGGLPVRDELRMQKLI